MCKIFCLSQISEREAGHCLHLSMSASLLLFKKKKTLFKFLFFLLKVCVSMCKIFCISQIPEREAGHCLHLSMSASLLLSCFNSFQTSFFFFFSGCEITRERKAISLLIFFFFLFSGCEITRERKAISLLIFSREQVLSRPLSLRCSSMRTRI